jgi:hypothetical protein
MMYVEHLGCFTAREASLAIMGEYLLSLSGPALRFQILSVCASDHMKGQVRRPVQSFYHSESEPAEPLATAAEASAASAAT